MTNSQKLINLGVPTAVAVEISKQIAASPTSFTPAEAQANSTATTLTEVFNDFNSLLTKLRNAGIIAP